MNGHPTALLLLSCSALVACGTDRPPGAGQDLLRPVRTMEVALHNELLEREFVGVVDADRSVDLAFRVSGKLLELPVREGDEVDAGQLLARLDQTDFSIQLDSARADYERARANFDRAAALAEKKLISQADYDDLKAQFAIAEAQLSRARQDLDYTRLTAPFEGVVAVRLVDNYSEIAAGVPVVTLTDLSSLVVRIDVPETIMINARRDGVRPSFVAAFEGIDATFPLSLKEVETNADEGTQTYGVTLQMAASDEHNILPGMTTTVRVRRSARDDSAAASLAHVPARSVLEDAAGRFVYVLEAADDGTGLVRRRPVETGQLSRAGIAVLSGLASGDRVITAGMSQLSDGMRVRGGQAPQ